MKRSGPPERRTVKARNAYAVIDARGKIIALALGINEAMQELGSSPKHMERNGWSLIRVRVEPLS